MRQIYCWNKPKVWFSPCNLFKVEDFNVTVPYLTVLKSYGFLGSVKRKIRQTEIETESQRLRVDRDIIYQMKYTQVKKKQS